MSLDAPEPPCFLAEWYRPDLVAEPLESTAAKLHASTASVTAAGTPVELVTMLAVPADDVLFGVFTADSVSVVANACRQAGIPAQRLTTAVDLRIAGGHGKRPRRS